MPIPIILYGPSNSSQKSLASVMNLTKKNSNLEQGLKIILSGSGIESDIKQKQVEANSLELSMKPEAQPIGSAVGG